MISSKTILILGAGTGGIATAHELRKHLSPSHRVILVDRERDHLFAPSLLWLMIGQRESNAIKRPLDSLRRKGIEVRYGEIEKIDPKSRNVMIGGEIIDADYIVVALGAELAPEIIPGLQESGFNFYTMEGAEKFRNALASLKHGRLVFLTAAPAYKCPAAPYEAALLVDHFLRENGQRSFVNIDVYAAEPGPMGVAGPEVSQAVKQMLQDRGVNYHPAHGIESVNSAERRLHFSNGVTADFDLLAYVPPHRAPSVVRASELASESGWISVDRHTLETRFADVYAIGDVVSIPLKLGKPLPKAGVFAHAQAKVVAKNIVASISGEKGKEKFTGHGQCFIEVGGKKAGFGSGDFYAEPTPRIRLHPPGWHWHIGKVLFEKSWLYLKL